MRNGVAFILLLVLVLCLAGCEAGALNADHNRQDTSNGGNCFSVGQTGHDEAGVGEDFAEKNASAEYAPIEMLKNITLEELELFFEDDGEEYHISEAQVLDINGDDVPEIILGANGWTYQIFYYADGSVHRVGNLSAWAWSSDLLVSSNGDVVLCTEAHTTGTAGLLQYRVFHWDGAGYTLAADLCRTPAQWDADGTPTGFRYFVSDTCVDLSDCSVLLENFCDAISQTDFEEKIAAMGTLTSLRQPTSLCEADRDSGQFMQSLRAELDTWR